MAVMSRQPLSGSVNGRAITHVSSDPGTTIHTLSSSTSINDTIYIWVNNIATEVRGITFQWGGTGTRDMIFIDSIDPHDGLYGVIPGMTLFGGTSTGSGLVVRAFGTATSSFIITGYVDRAS